MQNKVLSFSIISFLFIFSQFCSKQAEIHPEKLFQETEKAVLENYIFLNDEDQQEVFQACYKASLKSISEENNDEPKKALIQKLNSLNGSQKNLQTYKALKSFLSALPEGSNTFLSPESLAWSRDPEREAGIGLIIKDEGHGKFMAIDTIEGSASHRDKVNVGKYITKVDDVDVSEMDLDELVGRIKGPVDSTVTISFADRSYKLVRSSVSFQNILKAEWKLDGKKILYVVLRSTLPGSSTQLTGIIEGSSDSDALVLDLRKLQPGDFEESFKIANLFLPAGKMGAIRTKNNSDSVFNADSSVIYKKPIYLIVGSYQSPYADAVALALKNSGNVKIIGTDLHGDKSFITKAVKTGSGVELRITAGYIVNAEGKPLYKTGISADYIVKDILSSNPPFAEPDTNDPAQLKLKDII